MFIYLVRMVGTRDLVGIYFAYNEDELMMLIDECTDPGLCEFREIQSGGLFWSSPAVDIPLSYSEDDEADPDENGPIPIARASFTEGWWLEFFDANEEWTEVDPVEAKKVRAELKRRAKKPPTIDRTAEIVQFKKRQEPEDE